MGKPRGSQFTRKRAELAALVRHGGDEARIAAVRAELDAAEPDYRAERLAAHVRAVVDQAPPLTSEQRERIAAALRPTVAEQTA